MWLFMAVVAFCSSLGSLRAEEEEAAVFFKFYSFYQSKWKIEEEKEGGVDDSAWQRKKEELGGS